MSNSEHSRSSQCPTPKQGCRTAARKLTRRFRLPEDGQAERFAAAQVQICREQPDLFPYLYPIQNYVRAGTSLPDSPSSASIMSKMRQNGGRCLRHLNDILPRRTIRADVLLCGVWVWERTQEIRLLDELLTGLLQSGRSVLVLIHRGTTSHQRLRETATDLDAGRRVTFLDPRGFLGRASDCLRLDDVPRRTETTLRRILDALRPAELTLAASARDPLAWTVRCHAMWTRWASRLRFDTAIVRCHWLPLCSSVSMTARQRGVPVTTLQQGVISHTMDVPVVADQYVCFGESSATTLRALDADFAEATGRGTQCQEYVPVGSLIDPIEPSTPPFEARTLLVIGQFTGWAVDYYGLEQHQNKLRRLIRRLLEDTSAVERVVIRPHPAAGDSSVWAQLRNEFPHLVHLSSSHDHPISDDLACSSVALGLFSGALATAAAWGRPTFFLRTPGGYATPDLAPFSAQTGTARELFDQIRSTLSDRKTYREACVASRRAASTYYHQGDASTFPASRIDELLTL